MGTEKDVPVDTNGSLEIRNLVRRVAELQRTNNPHFRAVQAQCEFANEIYLGILGLCANKNGIAAEALVRTLFETVVSAAILAKHREKLADFIRYGKFTHLRILHFTDPPEPYKAKREKIKKATGAEMQELLKEFNNKRWHKLGTKDSFVEAGLSPAMYDKYYRRASPIAHGEPYVTLRRVDESGKEWRVEARKDMWRNYVPAAYIQSSLLMLLLISVVNEQFKLGFDKDIATFTKLVDKHKRLHMDTKLEALLKTAGPDGRN